MRHRPVYHRYPRAHQLTQYQGTPSIQAATLPYIAMVSSAVMRQVSSLCHPQVDSKPGIQPTLRPTILAPTVPTAFQRITLDSGYAKSKDRGQEMKVRSLQEIACKGRQGMKSEQIQAAPCLCSQSADASWLECAYLALVTLYCSSQSAQLLPADCCSQRTRAGAVRPKARSEAMAARCDHTLYARLCI